MHSTSSHLDSSVTAHAQAQPIDPPPQIALLQMITGYWVSQSIHAAASLGVADHLKAGEKTCDELAALVAAKPEALYRLMRALASVGIFVEVTPGKFATTPMAALLQSDTPGSLRDVSIMMGDREHYASWGNILHAMKTGESAFQGLFGSNVFEHYAQHPEPAAIFDRAMTSFSGVETAGVVADYDFSEIHTLVDVAGGHGSLLAAILQANSHMRGILFDTPEVIQRATSHFAENGLGDRCQLTSGSFFESVPAGADAYILKHILHDWDDERAIAILKQCRQAMAENGRVLVVEVVIPPGNDPFVGKLLDVNMLVMCPGGKERSAEEFEALFAAAGFKLTRIVPTHSMVSVVEGARLS